MGMSLRQIRYLYAIGVFKRDGSKSRLGKSSSVEGPSRQITKQLNKISSTLKVGEVSSTHRLRVGGNTYPIQKDKNGSTYPSVKGKTKDISSLPPGKVSIERISIRARKVTKPSAPKPVVSKTESTQPITKREEEFNTLTKNVKDFDEIQIGVEKYLVQKGKNGLILTDSKTFRDFTVNQIMARHGASEKIVLQTTVTEMESPKVKSREVELSLSPRTPGTVDKSLLKGITSPLVRAQVRDELEFKASLIVLDPSRLLESGYAKSMLSKIESDWEIEKKSFKLGQPMPLSIRGALELSHAYELRRDNDPDHAETTKLALQAREKIVEYGELRADQIISEMPKRNILSIVKKYSGKSRSLFQGTIPESQIQSVATTQDFLNSILADGVLPPNFSTPRVKTVHSRGDYGERSFYMPVGHSISMTKYADDKTLVHETSHALESDSKTWSLAHDRFVSKYFDRKNIQKLSKLTGNGGYLDSEEAYVPLRSTIVPESYIGKVNNAETVSMGFEALFTDPEGFRREYPEYFRYIISITQTPHSLRSRR